MIRVTRLENGGGEVKAELIRQPAIYLDQDSLADIARTATRRRRFLDIWANKGELLFSWANALELSGPQGDTVRYIRELLEALGPYWIPLELNPWKVARKENGEERSGGTSCVSESFLRSYFDKLHYDVTNLGKVVDLIQDDRENVRAEVQQWKTVADGMVEAFRSEFLRDSTSLDRSLPTIPYDPARPTTFMLRELERLVTREARQITWMPNDGMDFMHASIAGGWADFLLLDKGWKRRVLAVARRRTYPWVFYRYELDAFLDEFERCVVAR